MRFNILGISAYYHDSACCILKNGKLVAAAQEERFSRIKNDPSLPVKAFFYCLERADLSVTEIDCVAYYENPTKKLSRQLWSLGSKELQENIWNKLDPRRPEREIREVLGYDGEIIICGHHMSHAASSYLFSGFRDSAIMTMDGVGEWTTTTYGKGEGTKIELREDVSFPHSIGLLYSTITSYLGFGVNDGEFKVMGLAPYGKPLYVDKVHNLVQTAEKGQYMLNMEYFDFLSGEQMYSEKLIELLGQPARSADQPITQFACDIARSLQNALEDIVLGKVSYLYETSNSSNLCMAGGVALNCVLNGKILERSPFKNLFIQPAANDAGCALGAAAYTYVLKASKPLKNTPLKQVDLGPEFSSDRIAQILGATSLKFQDYRLDGKGLLKEVAERLAKKQVIGWFQGRMEFGPRALGHRSILADPRDTKMKDKINRIVKKREGFRPFAPAILEDKIFKHFGLKIPSPFMLLTCQTKSPIDLPAVTHVDGSARVQTVNSECNPRFFSLLRAFEDLTGCPIILNTSFNVKDEPIVCSPEDAITCFINTDLDCLVLGDFVIDKTSNKLDLLRFLDTRESGQKVLDRVYTFI